jgi:hypothetical protein
MRSRPEASRRLFRTQIELLVVGLLVFVGVSSAADTTNTGVIQGSVFKDLNRDGIQQSEEPPLAGQQLYLADGGGAYVGTTLASDAGSYSFDDLAEGDYVVWCEASALRADWVPSTTESMEPRIALHVTGSASADFGWRPILRSTELAAPLSAYQGPNGLRVEMFNDALTAGELYGDLMKGTLVGPEAGSVTIRFGYGDSSAASTGAQQTNGVYSSYSAVVQIGWASWLNTGEQALFHEYGHAWSLYYAFIVQQDPSLAAYLAARGLAGDARVNSSYGWSVREMIAEDYRQLFGSPSAQGGTQMNPEIPPASQVPGLGSYLATTFTQPPPLPPPPPEPPAPGVSSLAVSPAPVFKSGTVSFTLNASASATVTILNSKGVLVRTLAAGSAEQAGSVALAWDRKNASGQRVKSGTYIASVKVVDSGGRSDTATASFSVS